jgi:hypothetical protein
MVRGTVVNHRRRCGKPNCRCAGGGEEQMHESVVLSYSDHSRTKFLMLPAGSVEGVRAATERFKTAKARLEAEGESGLRELIAELAARRRPSS